jgi:4-hydroxy-2-oxoglutarate aldolase
MATPFDADGAVDLDLLRSNTRRFMRTRLAGVVVLGSNGEAAYIDDEEAVEIVATTREEVPTDRVLVAGTGRDATRATMIACRRAAAVGADAVLVRPPSAFRTQMSADVLSRHYVTIADACPVPVLLYNFAAAFGVHLPVEVIARLAEHANIIGLKESGGDLTPIAEQIALTPNEFVVVGWRRRCIRVSRPGRTAVSSQRRT